MPGDAERNDASARPSVRQTSFFLVGLDRVIRWKIYEHHFGTRTGGIRWRLHADFWPIQGPVNRRFCTRGERMTLSRPFSGPILGVCRKVRGEALDILHEHLAVIMQTYTILDSLWHLTRTTRLLRGLQRLEMSIALDELPTKTTLIKKIIPQIPHLTEFVVICSEPTWSVGSQADGRPWLRNAESSATGSLLVSQTFDET